MFRSSTEVSSNRDVMITGVGMVTPLGPGREQTWQGLLAGSTAGRLLQPRDIDHFSQLTDLLKRSPGGAPVDHDEIAECVATSAALFANTAAPAEYAATFGQDCLNNLIAASLADALADANLRSTGISGPRTGCVIGSSKASLRSMEQEHLASHFSQIPKAVSRTANMWHNGFMPDAPLLTVRYLTGATGPSSCPVAACATGLLCAIEAAQLIASGQCDVCIAGSADASLRASVLAAFHRLGVTSRNNDPAIACRPFDQFRDGFIVGEGAAVIILESREHAEKRRANCYAKLTRGMWLTDCTGMTQVDSQGLVVAELLQRISGAALDDPADSDSIPDIFSFHGTATETNDQAESRGVKDAFPTRQPAAFAVKGAIGHLLGAAGSVELGLTLMSLKHGKVPGTANFTTADESCPALLSPEPQFVPSAKTATKLSLGFGGHVVAATIQRDDS
ncbi:MAG: beta-ketoacyl synthase N-terminal-like domain-containing protein [Fuerstiella sp.]